MMKPLKKPRIFEDFRYKTFVQQRLLGGILIGLLMASALLQPAQAIDLQRPASVPTLAKRSTNGAPDLDQLTRDLQRFLGGAQTAAIQRGTGPKASVNTIKDSATNAQPTWWVTAAENGTARQIKLKGKPVGTGLAQPKSKRTETETMSMIRSFLSSQSPALKLQDPNAELALVSSETDSLGYCHLRYTQKLDEVPVWPTGLTVHIAPDGELHLLTASIVPTPSAVSRIPAIAADKAVERAKAKVPGGFRGTNTSPELVLHWDSDAAVTPVRLAWKFRVSVGEHASWTAIMDAQTGGEISIQSDARTGSVMGSGTDLFGVTKTFPVWEQGGVYYMIDTTKPSYNGAPDALSLSANGLIRVLSYDGTTNVKNYVTSARKDEWVLADAVNVYGNIRSAFDYFLNNHARLGLADFGTTVSVYVRNGDQGLKNNATYQNGSITFYLGGFPKAKSLDVAAHEFTHGVIQYSSGLEYENQSGALNESFSDIFGEMVELSVKGANDWLIGADSGIIDRDMSNPGAVKTLPDWYPYPSKMSEYWGRMIRNLIGLIKKIGVVFI
jgi:bacillolysin